MIMIMRRWKISMILLMSIDAIMVLHVEFCHIWRHFI